MFAASASSSTSSSASSSSSVYPYSYNRLTEIIQTLEKDYKIQNGENPKRLRLIAFINLVKDSLGALPEDSHEDYERIKEANTHILLGCLIYAANKIQNEYRNSKWNTYLGWLKTLQPTNSTLFSMLQEEYAHLNNLQQATCLNALDDYLQVPVNIEKLELAQKKKESILSSIQNRARELSGHHV